MFGPMVCCCGRFFHSVGCRIQKCTTMTWLLICSKAIAWSSPSLRQKTCSFTFFSLSKEFAHISVRRSEGPREQLLVQL
ncbi:unnamed protein product [Gongylonema pulchrum]|uniref:Secreted protein n=1 Tax=Gongylonema pulchrum TaxID=637853 RepID=A0A183EVK6_9BILA|nr:unnamed protein product [Gongylonema pulchrum]